MKTAFPLLVLLCSALFGASPVPLSISIMPQDRTLRGSDSAQQFVVVGKFADGTERDLTESAEWKLSQPDAGSITAGGRFSPGGKSHLILTARIAGRSAQTSITVEGFEQQRTFSFARDIGGILTRKGCNSASCHGG